MFEGSRLNYIVPGYTGHIPKKVYSDVVPVEKEKPRYEIPGYAGYVTGIKPENLHAKTFGKLTYNISNGDYLKGQDHPVDARYVSNHTETHISPNQMLQRTAADIVGVPPKKIDVLEPHNLNAASPGPETDQFTQTRGWNNNQAASQSNGFMQTSIVDKNGKPYVKLGEPLPGYTGFNTRILANNIFGKTYAECRKDAQGSMNRLEHEKDKNYQTMRDSHPPIKY